MNNEKKSKNIIKKFKLTIIVAIFIACASIMAACRSSGVPSGMFIADSITVTGKFSDFTTSMSDILNYYDGMSLEFTDGNFTETQSGNSQSFGFIIVGKKIEVIDKYYDKPQESGLTFEKGKVISRPGGWGCMVMITFIPLLNSNT